MADRDDSIGTYMSKESSFGNALASSTFSAPEPITLFSVFGDSDCGEPLEAHQLRLDFTPTDEDDEYSQSKCCEFWKYIASRSDLQGLMVLPDKIKSSQSTDLDSGSKSNLNALRPLKPKTADAVSLLQIVEEKGLIDRAFEEKMQQSRCTLGSNDYELSAKVPESRAPGCNSPGVNPSKNGPNAPSNARALCEELGAWDLKHPKSMEPPGQPPFRDVL